MRLGLMLMWFLASACGPSAGKGTVDATKGADSSGPTGSVSGVVWAPGQSPGQVPSGEEIPIFGAIVSVTTSRRPPIPNGIYCESCQSLPVTHSTTLHDGSFSISGVPEGPKWLTIEKGQFRRELQINVTANQTLLLDATDTTLASEHNPAEGKWLPKVAIATAQYDQLHTIFQKMGIGTGTHTDYSPPARFDVFENTGRALNPTLYDLVSDFERLRQYHVLIIPCSTGTNSSALHIQQNLRNLRAYVAQGGKLYVTDWSGEWADNVFPASITLAPNDDTPASAYDQTNNTWDTSLFGQADGDYYDAPGSGAVQDDLRNWLSLQRGPFVNGGSGNINGANFDIVENFNEITSTQSVVKGTDDGGNDVVDTPIVWVEGPAGGSGQTRPLTVTYEPTGCGRVMYSTYHTTPSAHDGLYTQERVLLYLLLEVGVCTTSPVVQ